MAKRTNTYSQVKATKQESFEGNLLTEIRQLIESTKTQVAVTVNSAMTLMYWHIGDRINRKLLDGERAAYGKKVVANLSRELTALYGGREFSERNLWRMMQFASVFPDLQIVSPVLSQSTYAAWTTKEWSSTVA